MTYLRTLLIVVVAFALGTAVASFASLGEYVWTGLEAAMVAFSALVLVAWVVSARIHNLQQTSRIGLLAVLLVLNVVLFGAAAYVGLGFRRDAFSLQSRTEAALSLISPRLLSRLPLEVSAYSSVPAPGYEMEGCWQPGETPGFLGFGSVMVDGIEDASIVKENKGLILKILFPRPEWKEISNLVTRHPGTRIAVTAPCPTLYRRRVLLDLSGADFAKPITTRLVLLKLAGIDRLSAERFRLWVRRNPPIKVPGT